MSSAFQSDAFQTDAFQGAGAIGGSGSLVLTATLSASGTKAGQGAGALSLVGTLSGSGRKSALGSGALGLTLGGGATGTKATSAVGSLVLHMTFDPDAVPVVVATTTAAGPRLRRQAQPAARRKDAGGIGRLRLVWSGQASGLAIQIDDDELLWLLEAA